MFVVGSVFAFNSGGIFSNTFFMSPAAWSLGAGGLAFLILGLLSIPHSKCSQRQRQSAVDSIHRSLLSLYISEQIRSPQTSNDIASVVARNCLSPHSELLDPNVFPLFTYSEERLRGRTLAHMEHVLQIGEEEIFTSPTAPPNSPEPIMPPLPPPYTQAPPPTYAEVLEEDRRRNQNNRH